MDINVHPGTSTAFCAWSSWSWTLLYMLASRGLTLNSKANNNIYNKLSYEFTLSNIPGKINNTLKHPMKWLLLILSSEFTLLETSTFVMLTRNIMGCLSYVNLVWRREFLSNITSGDSMVHFPTNYICVWNVLNK